MSQPILKPNVKSVEPVLKWAKQPVLKYTSHFYNRLAHFKLTVWPILNRSNNGEWVYDKPRYVNLVVFIDFIWVAILYFENYSTENI